MLSGEEGEGQRGGKSPRKGGREGGREGALCGGRSGGDKEWSGAGGLSASHVKLMRTNLQKLVFLSPTVRSPSFVPRFFSSPPLPSRR